MDVPLFNIQQADIAPLMSSLIGTAVPTNNIGKLPLNYLNVTEVFIAHFISLLIRMGRFEQFLSTIRHNVYVYRQFWHKFFQTIHSILEPFICIYSDF